MPKKKKTLDMDLLKTMATDYRAVALKLKELEEEAKAIKDAITAECRACDVTDTLDLGSVLVVSQTRTTQKIDQSAVTPDWLYRFQCKGGRLTTKLNVEPDQFDRLENLLREVNFQETANQVYTLKLQAK